MKNSHSSQFSRTRSWPLWLSWLILIVSLIGEHFAGLSALRHHVAEGAIFLGFLAALGQLVNVI